MSWVELGPVVHPGQGATPEGRGQGRGAPLRGRLPRGHRGDTHTGLAPKALHEPPNPHTHPEGRLPSLLHFTDAQTEVHRGTENCPRLPGNQVAQQGLQPRQ